MLSIGLERKVWSWGREVRAEDKRSENWSQGGHQEKLEAGRDYANGRKLGKWAEKQEPENWEKSSKQSVQFSRSVVSDSVRPYESQHARPPCPSPTPEYTQTHMHLVGDAIQPFHLLSSPSPPTPNPSQHQGLFQWVNSSHEVAKVLEFQLQHQSFQWTPRTDLLQDGLVGSPCSPRDSQESSPTP